MNVLWIMSDQLRWDYLGCYGATHIDTPNLDWLASRGVRFDRAYVQSPICGPSRMSFYTGRYVRSHGATWNGFPLRVGEPTLGDHLREAGVTCGLVGKTHMTADIEGMRRLGIDPASPTGRCIAEGGFEVFVRDDGTNHSAYPSRHAADYDAYLRAHGMDGDNPWEEWANTAIDPATGEMRSGWALENSHLPARVPKEHSETAWLTTRGIEYIEAQGDAPWLCHLSYIKPHWPYLAPAPYHAMYGPDDIPPPVRSAAERETDHPLMRAWLGAAYAQSFSRDAVRDRVVPAYMGLVKELDDQLGRLFDHLRDSGRMDDTMIVFCSDHGDNLGDHWLGEKDLFYDCSARIPLIVVDPRDAADTTRGTACEAPVEGIDLPATFLDAFGIAPKPHILEGRSLMPWLHGEVPEWRDYAVSEYDYATREARTALGIDQRDARLTMIFDGRWKYIHSEGHRPMLFDLETDPDELTDLGGDPAHGDQIARLREAHFDWARQHHSRTTLPAERIEAMARGKEPPGIFIGHWNRSEAEAEGRPLPDHVTG
ncbi:alkaline phosphatase family protein [Pseudaestuariivita atlantica]|uniref:Phosphonate monoester hydrolase n=1 Tax=Pseudaestuariivita atlantica TaxID=1317121 RepID=A0A0L1JTU7_9RHOB|nr:alkaline phosphatase family protein [Pseudaestuariivita atlantica]KNG95112.1 phosphonate monoester hydrolase [Pseudaestuariivita atlantica]